MIRILVLLAFGYLALVLAYAVFQRRLLYYPTHHGENFGLSEWRHEGRLIGYAREVKSPTNVWLMLHGNGGQASDRAYALSSFSGLDSVYIVEYPGYGSRPGSPSMEAFNGAAREAYGILRSRFPKKPICVVGESIGGGPAAVLATNPHPPDKIVLIAPFDTLSRVAAHHLPVVPGPLVGMILRDDWNNIDALQRYEGPVDIFGARGDDIIPMRHAKALAESRPSFKFHVIEGGHNEWADGGRVAIRGIN